MKKALSIAFFTGAAAGAGSVAAVNPFHGHASIHFMMDLPDGGSRDLGRSGCYDLSKVKAVAEPCK